MNGIFEPEKYGNPRNSTLTAVYTNSLIKSMYCDRQNIQFHTYCHNKNEALKACMCNRQYKKKTFTGGHNPPLFSFALTQP